MHLLVLALVLPLALSSALPVFARVLNGLSIQQCPCHARGGKSDCACPVCSHHGSDRLGKGPGLSKCGDEDRVFGASLGPATLATPVTIILPPQEVREAPPPGPARIASVFLTPPTPPPRFALS
jgi:hypothetical protein